MQINNVGELMAYLTGCNPDEIQPKTETDAAALADELLEVTGILWTVQLGYVELWGGDVVLSLCGGDDVLNTALAFPFSDVELWATIGFIRLNSGWIGWEPFRDKPSGFEAYFGQDGGYRDYIGSQFICGCTGWEIVEADDSVAYCWDTTQRKPNNPDETYAGSTQFSWYRIHEYLKGAGYPEPPAEIAPAVRSRMEEIRQEENKPEPQKLIINTGDIFIMQRDNGLPDQLLVCHYCTETGIVFQLWMAGNQPGEGKFQALTEMAWDDFNTFTEQFKVRKFQLI